MSKQSYTAEHLIQLAKDKKIKQMREYVDQIRHHQPKAQIAIIKMLQNNLVKKNSQPSGILYALLLYKMVVVDANLDFYGNQQIFPQSIHDAVFEICKYRAKQPIKQKGKNYFIDKFKAEKSQQIQKMGIAFVNLALEIVQNMAHWYPKDFYDEDQKLPSNYALAFNKLKKEGVTFPQYGTYQIMKEVDKKKFFENYQNFIIRFEEQQQQFIKKQQAQQRKIASSNIVNKNINEPKKNTAQSEIPTTKPQKIIAKNNQDNITDQTKIGPKASVNASNMNNKQEPMFLLDDKTTNKNSQPQAVKHNQIAKPEQTKNLIDKHKQHQKKQAKDSQKLKLPISDLVITKTQQNLQINSNLKKNPQPKPIDFKKQQQKPSEKPKHAEVNQKKVQQSSMDNKTNEKKKNNSQSIDLSRNSQAPGLQKKSQFNHQTNQSKKKDDVSFILDNNKKNQDNHQSLKQPVTNNTQGQTAGSTTGKFTGQTTGQNTGQNMGKSIGQNTGQNAGQNLGQTTGSTNSQPKNQASDKTPIVNNSKKKQDPIYKQHKKNQSLANQSKQIDKKSKIQFDEIVQKELTPKKENHKGIQRTQRAQHSVNETENDPHVRELQQKLINLELENRTLRGQRFNNITIKRTQRSQYFERKPILKKNQRDNSQQPFHERQKINKRRFSIPKTENAYIRKKFEQKTLQNFYNKTTQLNPNQYLMDEPKFKKTLADIRDFKSKQNKKVRNGKDISSLLYILSTLRLDEHQIPFIPQYFNPVSIQNKQLRQASLNTLAHQQTSEIFYENDLVQVRLIKAANFFILSFYNVSGKQIQISFKQQQINNIPNKNTQINVLISANKKSNNFEWKIDRNKYLDFKFAFRTTDLNFRFLELLFQINAQPILLFLPITLLDFCEIKKYINLQKLSSYAQLNGRIVKSQPFQVKNPKLPLFMNPTSNSQNRLKSQFSLVLRQKNKQQNKRADVFILSSGGGNSCQVNIVYDNRIQDNEDFAKVLVQLLVFLLI